MGFNDSHHPMDAQDVDLVGMEGETYVGQRHEQDYNSYRIRNSISDERSDSLRVSVCTETMPVRFILFIFC